MNKEERLAALRYKYLRRWISNYRAQVWNKDAKRKNIILTYLRDKAMRIYATNTR